MRFLISLLFDTKLPISYENYRDISYSKPGAASYTIKYIDLVSGELIARHHFNKGFLNDHEFAVARYISAKRIASSLLVMFVLSPEERKRLSEIISENIKF